MECMGRDVVCVACCGRYQSGDHVAVHAENSVETVQAAAECLGLPLDLVFSLAVPEGCSLLPEPFPTPISLSAALAQYADLLNSPKKVGILSVYAGCSQFVRCDNNGV